MPSPKVIIHRLDAPWLRDTHRQRRSRHRTCIIAAGFAAGLAAFTGTLNIAAVPDIPPPAPSLRTSLTQN